MRYEDDLATVISNALGVHWKAYKNEKNQLCWKQIDNTFVDTQSKINNRENVMRLIRELNVGLVELIRIEYEGIILRVKSYEMLANYILERADADDCEPLENVLNELDEIEMNITDCVSDKLNGKISKELIATLLFKD